MADPIPIEPDTVRARGWFPRHDDRPRPLRTADEARERARQRLQDWRAVHG